MAFVDGGTVDALQAAFLLNWTHAVYMEERMEFFATCPAGFEQLLAKELRQLGTPQVRPLRGQVSFAGEIEAAYRVCLWSRLASRVIVVLGRFDARSSDEFYKGASAIPWEEHIDATSTFAVDATGTNDQLKSTQFTAVRTKDAVVDRIAAIRGARPSVNTKRAGVAIVVRVSRNRATIGIDLAGDPLFRRSYGRGGAQKGLRADYAAALLALGLYDKAAQQQPLLACAQYPDTLLVEAALMWADHAPGLGRTTWGFSRWTRHDANAWEQLVEEARGRGQNAVDVPLYARSFDARVSKAKSVLRSLGIVTSVQPLTHDDKGSATEAATLVADVSDLRAHEVAKEASWLGTIAQIAKATRASRLLFATRDNMPSAYANRTCQETVRTMLGREPLELQRIEMGGDPLDFSTVEVTDGTNVPVLVSASDQFASRLKKMARLRAKWAAREDVSCYRLYDSDLPDYAVTIDLFQGTNPKTGELDGRRWLQIYEYAAPKEVDATLARSRLMDVLAIAPRIVGVAEQDTFLHVRRRDKGGSQYAAEAKGAQARGRIAKDGRVPLPQGAHLIDEGGLTFEVNFSNRLDCGIFLDHRDTRALLREMAKQTQGSKRFLNLFAYTGTATCYAADGGARHTTTVDLSRPSLDWARRNMARNGFVGKEHEFVQADVIAWIREQRRTKNRWDLVFCDVPTFSNSNRMGRRSFDVQRDHAELLIGVSRLLTRNGSCVFSCNLRTFKPDEAALAKAGVVIEDITDKTIPEDFLRNKRIHHAFVVRRG